MSKDYKTAVFFTSATCNLKCKYCTIDKNESLFEIDKKLEQSFLDKDYYINQVKKYFSTKDSFQQIETWGGEPFLHMERIFPLLHQLIDEYPYFKTFYSSTNFAFPNWPDKFFALMQQFGQYESYRTFNVKLQLSVDGPKEINDKGRGLGTTQKCLKNFKILCERLPNELPSNINLHIFIKGTLDNASLLLLDSKEKIIEYYQFIEENYLQLAQNVGLKNCIMSPTVPNTAVPSPVTVHQGVEFAHFVKNCLEIEKENKTKGYFKFYSQITPFSDNEDIVAKCEDTHFGCGAGKNVISFLPDNLITFCHEGFTFYANSYQSKTNESNKVREAHVILNNNISEMKRHEFCMTEDEYSVLEQKMSYYGDNSIFQGMNLLLEIQTLAAVGQIDKKYLSEKEARKALAFYVNNTAYCIKDNYNITGTFTMIPVGMFKLLLNGAMDEIIKEHNSGIRLS